MTTPFVSKHVAAIAGIALIAGFLLAPPHASAATADSTVSATPPATPPAPLCRATPSPADDAALMPGVLTFTMTAASNGQRYQVRIHRPSPGVTAPPGGFPVLYVLDGNAAFVLAAQSARLQERVTGGLVVVGVDVPGGALFDPPSRYRDLTTPPASGAWGVPHGPDGAALTTGGADAFLRFLSAELPASVAACAPFDARRTTLFGHSLGGFFVLHALFTQPALFGRYIAASPSIWWNDRALLGELGSFHAANRPALRLIVGGGEQTLAPNSPPVRVERVTRAAMNDNVHALYDQLLSAHHDDVDASLTVYDRANHVSYLPAALSDAVQAATAR